VGTLSKFENQHQSHASSTKNRPETSKPKLKRIARSIDTQIEIENNSQNTISAGFEKHFIVRNN